MGPLEKIDECRVSKAFEVGGLDTTYLISGGDLKRLPLMQKYLEDKGAKQIIFNEDKGVMPIFLEILFQRLMERKQDLLQMKGL